MGRVGTKNSMSTVVLGLLVVLGVGLAAALIIPTGKPSGNGRTDLRDVLLEVSSTNGEPIMVAIFWQVAQIGGVHPEELVGAESAPVQTPTITWSVGDIVVQVGDRVSLNAEISQIVDRGTFRVRVRIGGKDMIDRFQTFRTFRYETIVA